MRLIQAIGCVALTLLLPPFIAKSEAADPIRIVCLSTKDPDAITYYNIQSDKKEVEEISKEQKTYWRDDYKKENVEDVVSVLQCHRKRAHVVVTDEAITWLYVDAWLTAKKPAADCSAAKDGVMEKYIYKLGRSTGLLEYRKVSNWQLPKERFYDEASYYQTGEGFSDVGGAVWRCESVPNKSKF
jgi:hypothetical protein